MPDRTSSSTEVGDAFGLACREHHRDPSAGTTVDVEFRTGGVFHQPVSHYFGSTEDWPAEERALLSAARGRVLDVGVGVGQYALELQDDPRVESVTGIDNSPLCLEVARDRGLRDSRLHDVREPALPGGPYDTFLMMGHNIALLDPSKDGPALLERMAQVASPGARVLGTVQDGAFLPSEVREPALPGSRVPGVLSMELRLVHGAVATDWFDYCFVGADGLGALCAGTAWELAGAASYLNGHCVELRLGSDERATA